MLIKNYFILIIFQVSNEVLAKTSLAEMDLDQDGKISLDEYIKACLGNAKITKMLSLKIVDIFVEADE